MISAKPTVYVVAYPSTNINEGSQLNISCRYESNLVHDNVYWYKKSNTNLDILSNGSFSVFISNSSKVNAGNYICHVKNRVGTGEANITVTVNCKYYVCLNMQGILSLYMLKTSKQSI